MFNKKASLEISIQAIVIVVLAMTILGLGLGFVKGMFKNISGIQETVSDQVKDQILEDLRSGDKRISFPTSEVKIGKSDSAILGVGISNRGDQTLKYKIQMDSQTSGGSAAWFQYSQTDSTLEPSQNEVKTIRLSIPSTGVNSGSYLFTVKILDVQNSNNVFAQKDFFVVVRG